MPSWATVMERTTRTTPDSRYWRPYRAASKPVVFVLANLGVPAWVATLAGGALGLSGLWLVAFGPGGLVPVLGAIALLQVWILFDFVDGGLARVHQTAGPVGEYLDSVVHNETVQRAILPALAWRVVQDTGDATFLAFAFLYCWWALLRQWHRRKAEDVLPKASDETRASWLPRRAILLRSVRLLESLDDLFIQVGLVMAALLLPLLGAWPVGWPPPLALLVVTTPVLLLACQGMRMVADLGAEGLPQQRANLRARLRRLLADLGPDPGTP